VSTRPTLAAEHRTVTGKKVATLRRAGTLPAVIFGGGKASEPIQVSALDWEVLRRGKVTRNSLLDLIVDGGKPRPVLVQSITDHPTSRRPIHVDFHVVKMSEELTVDVPVVFVGDAPAVEKEGGTLIHLREQLHIRALPNDLPTAIEVDVTSLVDFEVTLHVSDVVPPAGVHILTDGAEPLARVMAPRVEVVEEAEVDLAAGAPEEGGEATEAAATPPAEEA
jgi:large subunit ribosomal protein L25